MSIPFWEIITYSFGNALNTRRRRLNKAKQEIKSSYNKEHVAKELDWAKKSLGKLVKREYHRKDDMDKWNNFASSPSKSSKKEQVRQLKTASNWLDKFYDRRKFHVDEEKKRERIIKAMNKKHE